MFFGAAGLLISFASYVNGRWMPTAGVESDEKRTKWLMTT